MGVEEIERYAALGRFPRNGLRAVLAELEGGVVILVGPGAARAVEAVRLVGAQQQHGRDVHVHLLANGFGSRAQRTPATGGAVVGFDSRDVGALCHITVAKFQTAVEAECGKGAGRAGQQVDTDIGEPEVGRQSQRHQRRKRRSDQPGQIGGQCCTGVTVPWLEVGVHGAGCLSVGQPEQAESEDDEEVLAEPAAIQQCRCKPTEYGNHNGEGAQRSATSVTIRDFAGDNDADRAQRRAEHLHAQELADGLVRIQLDPRQRKYRHEVEQRVARQRGEGADDDCRSLVACDLDHAGWLELALIQQLGVLVGRHQSQPGEQRDDVDGECNIERIAPAPVEEVIRRKARVQEGEQRAGDHETRPARRAVPASRTSRGGAAGALSASSDGRPSHEPPSAMPWPTRKTDNSTMDAESQAAVPGRKAMPAVEMPSRNSAAVSLASRPKRSWMAMKAIGADGPRDERRRRRS